MYMYMYTYTYIIVFIQKNKLTAATLYNYVCFVPEMVEKEEEIKKCISEFWHSVKDKISAHTYTMDLALMPDLQGTKIIELNAPVCVYMYVHVCCACVFIRIQWIWRLRLICKAQK